MLTYRELLDLERELRGHTVLSVYVHGGERDPAQRHRWRLDLRHAFDDIASWLEGASHSEREAFAFCREAATVRLSDYRGTVRAPGWAGFFTADGEHHAGPLPAAMPTMAVWSTGACLTPYLSALKEAEPTFVVVADSRKARLFRYVAGRVQLLETLRAHVTVEPPSHMGHPQRQGFHTGTRGTTGTDEAQREHRVGTERLVAETSEALARLAATEGWIAVGGIPSVAASVLARLPAPLALRAVPADRLDVHATQAQVAEAARLSASAMMGARELSLVNEALAGADAGGAGVVGAHDTTCALQEGRVRDLFLTPALIADHASAAEEAVRAALASGAAVECVTGAAAARLDAAGGMAARLRYVVAVPEQEGVGAGAG